MTTDKTENYDFFFWLGEDGEAVAVTSEEFEQAQKLVRETARKHKEVDIGE